MNLDGKKVLVTGGGRRVGAALVRAFAARGAELVIHCHASRSDAEELAREVGGGARVVVCDLREKGCAETLLDAAGDVDVLVNNASIYNTAALSEAGEAELERFFQVNCFAPLALIRELARRGRPGAVVNLLDQEVLSGTPARFGAYSLSRRSLAEATRAAALEFAPRLRVNAIAPGPVLPPEFLPHSRMEKTLATLPLPHPVSLSDLCAAAVLLAENESMTGAILPVDCGQSLTFRRG